MCQKRRNVKQSVIYVSALETKSDAKIRNAKENKTYKDEYINQLNTK